MFGKIKPIEEKFVKICPRCTSPNITTDKDNVVSIAYAFPAKYRCQKCGFLSNTFPEVKIKDLKKQKNRAI